MLDDDGEDAADAVASAERRHSRPNAIMVDSLDMVVYRLRLSAGMGMVGGLMSVGSGSRRDGDSVG